MIVVQAWRSLAESWQRSVLSAMGVMVASIAILLLVSIGLGVREDLTKQVADLGVNVVVCVPGHVEMSSFNPNLGGQSYFEPKDAVRLKKVPGVKNVATLSFAGGGARYEKQDAYPLIIAATPEWFEMRPIELEAGRVYTSADAGRKVVVLGGVARKLLFQSSAEAVGKEIEINKVMYEIIGVSQETEEGKSLFSMQSLENIAYIPYSTFHELNPAGQIDRLMVQSDPSVEPKTLVSRLDSALGERLDRQQYTVLTQEDLLQLIYSVMGILQTLVIGLTSIALFVGGIGIMAIMMLGVNERHKEIGVRRAVGATARTIFRQILAESVIISLSGVFGGLVVSLIVAWALATFSPIKPLITPGVLALAFGVGIGVGGLSGLLPAMRAARQDPAVALRNE
jgi:putative ABC transport system permease protein